MRFVICLIYIWPFAQYHVIQTEMSKIEQSTAEASARQTAYRLHKTVALVGMMGAGKTAVGRSVAQILGVPFLDSDSEIEAAANLSVPEIFKRDGEAFFRAREAEVIERLLSEARGILSTGGGAYLAPRNRESISTKGVALWLNADAELLWQRVKNRDTRPLLRTADPKATLTAIYNERVPIYQKADLSVPCDAKLSIEAMTTRVVDVLLTRPDVLEIADA